MTDEPTLMTISEEEAVKVTYFPSFGCKVTVVLPTMSTADAQALYTHIYTSPV